MAAVSSCARLASAGYLGAAAVGRREPPSRPAVARPTLVPAQPRRCSQLQPAAVASRGRLVAAAAAANTPPSLAAVVPNLVVGASVLGLVQPALFSAISPAFAAPAVAAAVFLSSLSLDTKGEIAVSAAGAMAAAVAAPYVAATVLGVPKSVDGAALLTCAAKVALLPLLAGAALTAVLPHFMAPLAPAASVAAAVLTAVACGSMVAQHAQVVETLLTAPGNTWWRLVAAGLMVLASAVALRYTASKAAGLPDQEARLTSMMGTVYAGAAGAVLARAHFAAQPLVAVGCVVAAALAASISSSALRETARAMREAAEAAATSAAVSEVKSWEVPADTYIKGVWDRLGVDPSKLPPASATPTVPANVADARAWIAAWRAKRGGA